MRSLRPVILLLSLGACAVAPEPITTPRADAFLDDVQRRTFDFFWETTNPANGLTPDRWPSRPFSSIAAVGFALTAYGVGAERGWITREQARERTLATVRFFWRAPQGPATTGVTGHRGFFYHFLDMESGLRFQTTELSTIDSALLLAGVLFAQSYFDEAHPAEAEIRALADSLYLRVEWPYFQTDERGITMAWRPEPERLFGPARWNGYDESIILHVLALGSPTHPAGREIWDHYTRGYEEDWGEFQGQEHLNFAPLFGHQYSHVWIDFRGIQDERERYGEHLYQRYGFLDAFNPTLATYSFETRRGAIVPGVGWFEDDYLGIDQGPIVTMIENYRSELVRDYMKRSPYIVRGLCRAGFRGGWLEGRCEQ
jgi:hypothetical protein